MILLLILLYYILLSYIFFSHREKQASVHSKLASIEQGMSQFSLVTTQLEPRPIIYMNGESLVDINAKHVLGCLWKFYI